MILAFVVVFLCSCYREKVLQVWELHISKCLISSMFTVWWYGASVMFSSQWKSWNMWGRKSFLLHFCFWFWVFYFLPKLLPPVSHKTFSINILSHYTCGRESTVMSPSGFSFCWALQPPLPRSFRCCLSTLTKGRTVRKNRDFPLPA